MTQPPETVRVLHLTAPREQIPPVPPATASQHLDLLARVLRRDLETLERLHAEGLVSFVDVEECRAAIESVAALRGLT